MLEATEDLDPAIFEKGNEGQFGLAVGFAVQLLEQSGAIVAAYEGFDRAAVGKAIAGEIEDDGGETAEKYDELAELMGEDFMVGFMADISDEKPSVSEEEYQAALARKREAQATLVNHTVGHYEFMRDRLIDAYRESSDEVDAEAWTATWKKLKEVLGGEEGTLLAEAASFFDGLVREKFGDKYRAMEEDRGPAVSADPCARTFYVVMQDHLHRAIIGANRDEWTGYE